jgi:hypothetical protein
MGYKVFKVIAGIYVFCMSFLSLNAQDCAQFSGKQDDLVASRDQGKFVFIFPDAVTEEDIASSAVFYSNYFSIDYNISTKEVLLTMRTNDDKSRHIIVRFLTSCGISKVKVSEATYSLDEFFNRCLRS